jgi:hypothetical protein
MNNLTGSLYVLTAAIVETKEYYEDPLHQKPTGSISTIASVELSANENVIAKDLL